MKQKEEEMKLSDAQESAKLLKNLQVHSQYKEVEGIPIPAQNGILVKQLEKSKIFTSLVDLEGGGKQEIYGAMGNNTQDTCEGLIMAVGPNCSPTPRKGLKIQYASHIATNGTKFYHKNKEYLAMDEYSILFYMPDETTRVDNGVKDARQVRREKKIPQQQQIIQKMHERDQNEKDVAKDKTKGKIKPVSTKYK